MIILMIIILVIVVFETIIVTSFLQFLWHWWQSDALRQIRQWVDKTSLLVCAMEE